MQRFVLYVIVLFVIFLAGCVPTSAPEPARSDIAEVGTVPSRDTPTPPTSGTPTPTYTPYSPLGGTPTANPTVLTTTPWPPDPLPSPTPASPFPGMLSLHEDGLWLAQNQGWDSLVTGISALGTVPTIHGRRLLAAVSGDIYLAPAGGGSDTVLRGPLITTPDVEECCPQWWPAVPDTIFFLRQPEYGSGLPVMVNLNTGTETSLIPPDASFTTADMAGSPDGRYIALAGFSQPLWLYDRVEASHTPFNPADYGFPADWTIVHILAPSWSPDGRQLASVMDLITSDGPAQIGLGIFDLVNQTFQLHHPYVDDAHDHEGWFPPAAWSPDGRWIAFVADDRLPESATSLWMIDVETGAEQLIPGGSHPVWSPDGRYLAYRTNEGTFLTYPPDFTYKIGVSLPPEAELIGWQELP